MAEPQGQGVVKSARQTAVGEHADGQAPAGDDAPETYTLGDDFKQLQHAKIMMVDDEPLTMEVVQMLLEDAGYREFHLVDDSTRAMAELEAHRPDVLLLDVMMPEISGFDILKMLRRNTEFGHLPVIILTSSTDAETKLTALDLGATDFLSKPVDPSELALRVRNTLAAKAYQDQLAYYDALTNLPNLHLFKDRAAWAIERSRREQTKTVLVHIKFTDFRRINEALGPDVGDGVLIELARRFNQHLRAADSVSRNATTTGPWNDVFRVGGADFSVLLPAVDGIASAGIVAQRILEVMQARLDILGHEIYLTPSIGIAGFPDDADDTRSLTKCAMSASQQAIDKGGAGMMFYSAEMNELTRRRFHLETDMRRAIENNEFCLLYQPKVAVDTGEIVGAEALIRWHKSDGEIVSPVEFIPVAEQTGMILPIGEWVLNEACAQIARWQAQGLRMNVAVNLSARQFFESNLVDLVGSAIDRHAIDARQLTLEVTETLMIDRVDEAISTMTQLRGLGCPIAMDDFGTGYSSLSYLKRFPLDEVKIDREFLIDVLESRQDKALISAITYLAHQFGFKVCAEGVEQQAQLDLLRKVKCDEYQGFLFSRPVPSAELSKRLGTSVPRQKFA